MSDREYPRHHRRDKGVARDPAFRTSFTDDDAYPTARRARPSAQLVRRAVTVHFAERTLAGAPVLLATPGDAEPPPRAAVLWYHGFGARASDNRAELARIARAGFTAVGVDAVGHGARRLPDLDARIALPLEGARGEMLALADASAHEVPALVRALVDEGIADSGRIALVGVSMGGYLAYRAVARAPALRVVVALLGSPEWPDADSPHLHPDRFDDIALLSVTAERDASVPPAAARRFHEALRARRAPGERVRHVELAGAEHLMSAAQWERLMDETVEWLVRHLPA